MDDKDTVKEPTRFAWVYDGLLIAGTLVDWAKAWEADHYAGDEPPPRAVITWSGVAGELPQYCEVLVVRLPLTEDDMIPYLITVPGLHDTVYVSVDGRA